MIDGCVVGTGVKNTDRENTSVSWGQGQHSVAECVRLGSDCAQQCQRGIQCFAFLGKAEAHESVI